MRRAPGLAMKAQGCLALTERSSGAVSAVCKPAHGHEGECGENDGPVPPSQVRRAAVTAVHDMLDDLLSPELAVLDDVAVGVDDGGESGGRRLHGVAARLHRPQPARGYLLGRHLAGAER